MTKVLQGIGLAVMVLLAAAPGVARADGKTKMAVKSLRAQGVDAAVAATLESSLCAALAERYEVLCPGDIAALVSVKQAELSLGACEDDAACIQNIAQVAEASRVVAGEVGRVGKFYVVNLALLDPATNKVIARATEKTAKLEDLLDKVPALARQLSEAK